MATEEEKLADETPPYVGAVKVGALVATEEVGIDEAALELEPYPPFVRTAGLELDAAGAVVVKKPDEVELEETILFSGDARAN